MIGVGEYVRTKKGIFKILGIKTVQTKMNGNHDLAYLIDDCPLMYIIDNNFIKHSKNIIDLIEKRRLCEWKICRKNKTV